MKRYMRLICLSVVLLLFVRIPLHADADVIFFPDDPFFEEHISECTRLERSYTASGPDDVVTVYKSPESDRTMGKIENGSQLFISYLYTDESGIEWGYYENWEASFSGWIPMANLTLVYDARSFQEEHGHEIREERGMFADVFQRDTARFHPYPGSPDYQEVPVKEWNGGKGAVTYSRVYVDAKGDRWVMVDKAYSIMDDAWVNVDAEESVPTMQETVPQKQEETKPEPQNHYQEILPDVAIWVVILTVVTGILLLLIKKKK